MRKLLLFTAIFTCILNSVGAQSPEWLWAYSGGQVGYDYGLGSAIDSFGNSFLTGHFAGTVAFGNNNNIVSEGSSDLFIIKLDEDGQVLWVRTAGGDYAEIGTSVATDKFGNCYIAGYYRSAELVLDSDTLRNTNNANDLYIVKYDPDGNVLWTKTAGGTGDDRAISITVNPLGNVYVTGFFTSDNLIFGTYTLNHSADQDVYVLKLDADGNVIWALAGDGTGRENPYAIASDKSDNCYLAGAFSSSALKFGSTQLTKHSNNDLFIVKFDANGNAVWTDNTGFRGDNAGRGVAVDTFGNIYMTGEFFEDPISFGTFTLQNSGHRDFFVVKYSKQGIPLWAHSAGGAKEDAGYAITIDRKGYCYVSGIFKSPTMTIDTVTLTNALDGASDIFVAEYDPAGDLIWVKTVGGTGSEVPSSICVDSTRNFYISGQLGSPVVDFGTVSLNSKGTTDFFMVKSDNTPVPDIPVVSALNRTVNNVNISVLPNPADNYLSITIPVNAKTEILNINGQRCIDFLSVENETIIDISDLNPGMYFIKSVTGKEVFTGKFIKR